MEDLTQAYAHLDMTAKQNIANSLNEKFANMGYSELI